MPLGGGRVACMASDVSAAHLRTRLTSRDWIAGAASAAATSRKPSSPMKTPPLPLSVGLAIASNPATPSKGLPSPWGP